MSTTSDLSISAITRRLVLAASVLAGFGTACTAIVAARLSDTNDYSVDGSAKSSSSSGSAADKCDLLHKDYATVEDPDANVCSTCIATSCKVEVDYACQRGTDERAKDWFSLMQECARSPYNGYSPQNSGASSYGCGTYKVAQSPIQSGGDDSEHKRASEICINQNCLQGDTPPCRLCEVSTDKTGTQERQLLRDDVPCGSCVYESCQKELSACCSQQSIRDLIEGCAFTADPEKKKLCNELGKSMPDAGESYNYWGDAGTTCILQLGACFKAHCTSACQ